LQEHQKARLLMKSLICFGNLQIVIGGKEVGILW
jgi:hypothetical protein